MPERTPVPAILQQVAVTTGKSQKYMRILVFGPAKSGKSFWLASMPKPIIAASGGDEQGIAQYLDPTQGDVCFDIGTSDQLLAFMQYAMANLDSFKSIVFDPITPIWEDYMDGWNQKLGGEIKGPQWQQVKGPWKLFMRQLKRAKLHLGMSAWVNDILYENVEQAPGVSKLVVRPQEVAKVEKRIPHHVDMIFLTTSQVDRKNRPTPIHEVIYSGGRRPRTIAPGDLYTGKKWIFDERTPKSPWEEIMGPILEKWQDATTTVDYLGPTDPMEERKDDMETAQIAADYMAGAILREISQASNLQTYKDETWPKKIAPYVETLDPVPKKMVMEKHEAKKKELMEASK